MVPTFQSCHEHLTRLVWTVVLVLAPSSSVVIAPLAILRNRQEGTLGYKYRIMGSQQKNPNALS